MLKESLANALDDPAMDLALKQERVDGAAEIVDDSVALDYDDAGIGVDLYLNDVASVRKGLSWRLPSLATGGDARADYGIAGVERSAEIVGGVVRFVGGDLRTDSESFGKNFGTLRSAPGLLAADGRDVQRLSHRGVPCGAAAAARATVREPFSFCFRGRPGR